MKVYLFIMEVFKVKVINQTIYLNMIIIILIMEILQVEVELLILLIMEQLIRGQKLIQVVVLQLHN